MSLSFRNSPLFIYDFSPIFNILDGRRVHPSLLPDFCQPDETMLFGKKLVQIVMKLKIALPSITGKPTNALSTDTRYRIKVHIPGGPSEDIQSPLTLSLPISLGSSEETWRFIVHLDISEKSTGPSSTQQTSP